MWAAEVVGCSWVIVRTRGFSASVNNALSACVVVACDFDVVEVVIFVVGVVLVVIFDVNADFSVAFVIDVDAVVVFNDKALNLVS